MGQAADGDQLPIIRCLFVALVLMFSIACTKSETVVVPVSNNTSEIPYCSTSFTYSNGVTISGTGLFNVRQSSGSGLGGEVLGGPIRHAEVMFLDENGATVQCAETD